MSGGGGDDDKTRFLKCFERLKEELVRDEIDDNRVQIRSRLDTEIIAPQRPAREVEQRDCGYGRDESVE